MGSKLPEKMTHPRKARPLGGSTADGWWYVNYGSIDVYADLIGTGVSAVRLTRRQLEQALKIMDECDDS